MFTIPEGLHIVNCWGPGAGDGIGTNGDYVSLKNVQKAFAIFKHAGANDTDLVCKLKEATTVAGGSATDITASVRIWTTPGTTSSDTWTRETDAATYTIDPATLGSAIVVMEVNPIILSSGFDCIQAYTTGGHASNFATAFYMLQMRYKSDSPPSAIAD